MSPETIRARALECMQLAQNTEDGHHRSHLLDVGHLCADLANALDRFQLFADAVEESLSEPVIFTPVGPHHRLAGPASAVPARRARSDSSAARPEPQHRQGARAKPDQSRRHAGRRSR